MDRFDRWARRRAGAGADGLDRRELLKRAGVVGAVVAASPLIQSVSSPASAAVSDLGVCSDPIAGCGGASCRVKQCPNNSACRTDSDCASGRCSNSVTGGVCITNVVTCTGASGDWATKDANCSSGFCERTSNTCTDPTPSAPGQLCHGATQAVADDNCLSGNCSGWNATSKQGTCS